MISLKYLRKLFCGPCGDCPTKDATIDERDKTIADRDNTIVVLEDELKALDGLLNGESQLVPPFQVKDYITVDGDWVKAVVKKYDVKLYRFPMDTEYYIPSLEDTAMILDWDQTDTLPYIPNRRDCDKFARRIWSRVPWLFGLNHVGLINDTSAGHAYNVFLTSDGELWVHEPQQKIFWEYDNDVMEGMYDAEHGIMLL